MFQKYVLIMAAFVDRGCRAAGLMRGRRVLTTGVAVAAFSMNLLGAHRPKDDGSGCSFFPPAYIELISNGDRFRDPGYFKDMAAGGLKQSDPKAIYAAMRRALDANENYKALYLARIFTVKRPDLANAWLNRASIAASLGFDGESASCQKRAKSADAVVMAESLPGNQGKVRPTDLRDWAASMLLLADSLSSAGDNLILAVSDDISGVVTSDNGNSPAVLPAHVKVTDIGPNLFILQDAVPMKYKLQNAGAGWGAMLAAAASGVASAQGNAPAADQEAQAAGELAAKASSVAFHYVEGSYDEVRFVNGAPRVTKAAPKATGENSVIKTPVPVLLASGSDESPCVHGAFRSLKPTDWHSETANKGRGQHPDATKTKFVALSFPKLLNLHLMYNDDEEYLTATEIMLTSEDVKELFPSLHASYIPALQYAEVDYHAGLLPYSSANSKSGLTGFDNEGNVYSAHLSADKWLVSVTKLKPAESNKKSGAKVRKRGDK